MTNIEVTVARGELLPPGERTLEQLADSARAGHARVLSGLSTVLEQAISIGDDLREAQAKVPVGDFRQWVEDNVPEIGIAVAFQYMRLSEFQDLLPHELRRGELERRNGKYSRKATIKGALNYLTTLNVSRGSGGQVVRKDYEEIRRLKTQGLSERDIAKLLVINRKTVQVALMPERDRRKMVRERSRKRREEQRLLKRAQTEKLIRESAPDLSHSYSYLRKCLQTLQLVHDQLPPSVERRNVASAINHLHLAEDAIGRAYKDQELAS